MSFFDDIFGSDSSSTQKQSGTSQTNTTSTKETGSEVATGTQANSTTTGTQTSTGTTNQATANLTPDQLQALDSLIQSSAGKSNIYGAQTQAAVGKAQDLASTALAGVQNQGQNLQDLISAQQGVAKQNFAEGEGANIEQFADATGSGLNSTVQLLRQKGQRDLATSLAGVTADTTLQQEQINNQQTAVAADAITRGTTAASGLDAGQSQALADALSALTVAKGATSATSGTDTSSLASSQTTDATTIQQQLTQELDKLLSSESTSSTGTVNSSGSSSDPFSSITGLLAALNK